MKDVGTPLAAICEHIYYWVDPTYVKPASSEPDKLHRLDWMKLLSQKLWKPKYNSKTSRDEMAKILRKQKTDTINLVCELAKFVESDLGLWKEEVNTSPVYTQLSMS